MGGNNARNNFSRNTHIVRAKKVGEKIVAKLRKNVFYIHTNIVFKKWGKKARNNFSRNTRMVRTKNVGKKIVAKSAIKRFI